MPWILYEFPSVERNSGALYMGCCIATASKTAAAENGSDSITANSSVCVVWLNHIA